MSQPAKPGPTGQPPNATPQTPPPAMSESGDNFPTLENIQSGSESTASPEQREQIDSLVRTQGESIEALMDPRSAFDTPSPGGTDRGGRAAPDPETAAQPAPAAPAAPAAPEAPAAPAPGVVPEAPALPTPDPMMAQMTATMQAMQQQMQAMQQQMLQPQAQAQPQAPLPGQVPAQPDPHAPPPGAYQLQIPQQIAEGIRSEDPNAANMALTQLVQGIGETMHRQVMSQVAPMIQAQQAQGQTNVQDAVRAAVSAQTQQQEVFSDFYTTYPQFNHPALRQTVAEVAAQVAREGQVQAWSPQLRDATAQRLQQMGIGGALAAPAASALNPGVVPAANAAPAPGSGFPATTPPSTRPGGGVPQNEQARMMADIANTLGLTG